MCIRDRITTGETFDGKGLLDWLNFTATQYAAAGKTLMIKIQMGVYDMNYLNTYQPDPAKKTASNNRIAIFIIPYDCLLYTSDAADEEDSVDLGGCRIIKK